MALTPSAAADYFKSELNDIGMSPTGFTKWEGWKVFKRFLQKHQDAADQGVSVQGVLEQSPDGQDRIILTMMQQCTTGDPGEDVPVACIGLEVAFAPREAQPLDGLELWRFDFSDLTEFVTAVEAHPGFRAAVNANPLGSELVRQEV